MRRSSHVFADFHSNLEPTRFGSCGFLHQRLFERASQEPAQNRRQTLRLVPFSVAPEGAPKDAAAFSRKGQLAKGLNGYERGEKTLLEVVMLGRGKIAVKDLGHKG